MADRPRHGWLLTVLLLTAGWQQASIRPAGATVLHLKRRIIASLLGSGSSADASAGQLPAVLVDKQTGAPLSGPAGGTPQLPRLPSAAEMLFSGRPGVRDRAPSSRRPAGRPSQLSSWISRVSSLVRTGPIRRLTLTRPAKLSRLSSLVTSLVGGSLASKQSALNIPATTATATTNPPQTSTATPTSAAAVPPTATEAVLSAALPAATSVVTVTTTVTVSRAPQSSATLIPTTTASEVNTALSPPSPTTVASGPVMTTATPLQTATVAPAAVPTLSPDEIAFLASIGVTTDSSPSSSADGALASSQPAAAPAAQQLDPDHRRLFESLGEALRQRRRRSAGLPGLWAPRPGRPNTATHTYSAYQRPQIIKLDRTLYVGSAAGCDRGGGRPLRPTPACQRRPHTAPEPAPFRSPASEVTVTSSASLWAGGWRPGPGEGPPGRPQTDRRTWELLLQSPDSNPATTLPTASTTSTSTAATDSDPATALPTASTTSTSTAAVPTASPTTPDSATNNTAELATYSTENPVTSTAASPSATLRTTQTKIEPQSESQVQTPTTTTLPAPTEPTVTSAASTTTVQDRSTTRPTALRPAPGWQPRPPVPRWRAPVPPRPTAPQTVRRQGLLAPRLGLQRPLQHRRAPQVPRRVPPSAPQTTRRGPPGRPAPPHRAPPPWWRLQNN